MGESGLRDGTSQRLTADDVRSRIPVFSRSQTRAVPHRVPITRHRPEAVKSLRCVLDRSEVLVNSSGSKSKLVIILVLAPSRCWPKLLRFFSIRARDCRASWVQWLGEVGQSTAGHDAAVSIGRRLEVGGREFGIRFAACRGQLRWGSVSRSVSQQGVRTGGP